MSCAKTPSNEVPFYSDVIPTFFRHLPFIFLLLFYFILRFDIVLTTKPLLHLFS